MPQLHKPHADNGSKKLCVPTGHLAVCGTEAARPGQLREANCRMLLRLLRSIGPCSKADLVRGSGLSATTVSVAVDQLSGRGLIQKLGDGESKGGRPPGLLRFHAEHGLVAAADVGGTSLRMMLANLSGQPVAHWATHLGERQKTPRAVVSLIGKGLREMARTSSMRTQVLHLVIGAPGITDVERGVVFAAPNLKGWTDLHLRELAERDLKVAVTVENDVNLAAVGEASLGVAKGKQDYVFIAVGTGVGAGVFLRGALHHGARWTAGEIGYLPVMNMPREPVHLERTGQLESVIGGRGIKAMWHDVLRRESLDGDQLLKGYRASQIFDLAAEGHALATEVLSHTACVLAEAITILALLYDPQMVVLGGGVGSHMALCRATEKELRKNQFAQPALHSSSLGSEAQMYGGISLALSAVEAHLLC